jgi:hypothetical protein
MQNAKDNTTFSSLCQRLNMLVLKQRSVVRGEAALMLHKPRISSFADVKEEFETYVASLECFLEHDKALVPPHVTDSIQRAYLDNLAGTVHKSVNSSNSKNTNK